MGEPANHRLRAVLCASVALVMVLTVLSSMQSSFGNNEKRGAENLANGSRTFNVGAVDYMTSVATLNPFVSTMSAEYETISPCYSTLLTYDVNANLIGDLATSWSLAPDSLTWNFKLAQNAHFIDPASPLSTAHQVTATDLMWTLWEVNNDTGNHLSSYLRIAGAGVIAKMWTGTDQWDLYVKTKTPYAPFIGALAKIPIVPEYIWGHLVGRTPLTYANLPPIGSGPFYYGSTGLPATVGILKRNPQWFQEANRGWQIHIDTLQFKNEVSADTAWADLTASPPLIDTYLNVATDQFIAHLVDATTPGVIGWAQSTGFVYEYQLNQLDPARRILYENAGLMRKGGTSNPLLLDPTVKLAMAMCVDKQAFIDQVLRGFGSVADSLVPDCNPWHYTCPNPVQFNPTAARTLLNNAGWAYDSTGAYNPNGPAPLYKKGATNNTVYQPLSFRLMSLNTAAEWAAGSNLLAQWAALGGVQLNVTIICVCVANSLWYAGDYDTWLWDWVFTPTSDPSTDCLLVDTTMEIGWWSGSYWSNATYDALYNASLVATDPTTRRQLTNQMQAMLYEDHNDQLIAYAKSLYAANTYYWNGSSYGDWAAHWALMPDQGYPWLYMQLSPTDNHAPTVTTVYSSVIGFEGTSFSLSGSAVDDSSTLKYQWYWGDGSVSGWQASASMSHTYSTPGYFTAYLAAQEQGTADGFIGWNQTTVVVVSNNLPPVFGNPPIIMSPSTGINTATVVTFTGQAADPEGDPIYYYWDFGDTFGATGPVVTHQFTSVGNGPYTVKLTITDNIPGAPPQVATKLVSVALNQAPQLSLPSAKTVLIHTLTTFTASASDQDGDPMRFTWVWGDGNTLVTTTPSATHSYATQGAKTLVLYADDRTGLTGHNVSATEAVNVINGPPTPPFGVTLSATPLSVWAGQVVTFTGSAQDPGGDAMYFNYTFGDGTYTMAANGPTNPNQIVINQTTHAYAAAGTMTAYMTASDGLSTTRSSNVLITVTLNSPPVVTPQTAKQANAGASVSFSATATDVDGDTLRYTWDFGDGSPLVVSRTTTHTYAKAGMYTFTVYVDDLTGLTGHNVTSSATASIAFNLYLVAGWNFISVPLAGYGYKASTLGLATGDVISSWNSTTQSYDHTYIKGISPPVMDFHIAPSAAYWVWVPVAKTLHLYGTVPTTMQTFSFTVPSGGGWVSLGLLGLKTRHASDIPAMYSGPGSIVMAAYYNTVTQKYTAWISGVPTLNNFVLVPGLGFWFWATASGTISYMP